MTKLPEIHQMAEKLQDWAGRMRRVWKRDSNRARSRASRLHLEPLEPRLLLAQAVLLQQQFRQDDFSLSGSYTYYQHVPASSDYIDEIRNGTFSGSGGHIAWTSPADGTGSFQGQAAGDGHSTAVYLGGRKGVADYRLEETGRFDFTIDAASSQLVITSAVATSTHYARYTDLTPNHSRPAPDPAPSRLFGGTDSLYSGTFDPSQHTVSINYQQPSPETTATAPATALAWANSAATDLELTILAHAPTVTIPTGWIPLSPSTPPPAVSAIDLSQGLEFTVDVHGKPLSSANVATPLANVRLFWASSATDTTGAEIPVTSNAGPVGLYWNSSQLQAIIQQFPAPPTGANYVRVMIDAPTGADANPANNSRYLLIEHFQAGVGVSGPISEDTLLDEQAGSLLAPLDRSDPDIKVYAYNPSSALGVGAQVTNDGGGYRYDPRSVPAIQALAPGETANDEIHFMAVKYGTMVADATRRVILTGVNDPPVAGNDSAATTNYRLLSLQPADLLAHDTDVDHNDVVTLQSVAATSSRGAEVQSVLNAAQTQIQEIVYDPSTSNQLRQLVPGQQVTDEITYVISDSSGATATGRVLVTITGEQPLTIDQVAFQLALSDQPTDPIPLVLHTPGIDPSLVQVTVEALDLNVIPAGNLQLTGTTDVRQLVVTPVAGVTGQTRIVVRAADGNGRSAVMSFALVVGLPNDLDLDGVPDDQESAAPNGGDMNADGVSDNRQPHVASLPVPGSNAFLLLSVPEQQFLAHVSLDTSPAPAGPATNADAQFPLGLIQFEVLVDSPGAATTATLRTDLPSPALNRYYQYDSPQAGGPGWRTFMQDASEGATVFADRIAVTLRDGGRGDQDASSDGRINCVAAPATVAHPWQNDNPLDINNDGRVTPVDVLILINQINGGRGGALGQLPVGQQSLPAFLDPAGDDNLIPLDVLLVIVALNNGAGGEGESASILSLPPSPAVPAVYGQNFPAASVGQRLLEEPKPSPLATDVVFTRLGAAASGSGSARPARLASSSAAGEWYEESFADVTYGLLPSLV
jgi:hypothetical protein